MMYTDDVKESSDSGAAGVRVCVHPRFDLSCVSGCVGARAQTSACGRVCYVGAYVCMYLRIFV